MTRNLEGIRPGPRTRRRVVHRSAPPGAPVAMRISRDQLIRIGLGELVRLV
ncbi:hypothetical protein P3T36_007087 [Kitasatospora sp. MAP12-15]|uniref:hypothetical protein n=1 Tax=unclassified Kitasatospora TaxID=2633591 RepID=UPI002474AD8D|nr:hypothetical protein [Kitasatospora sp. MAP12-44]MDH6108150.1 hypothetical protein [Kitasatospora sp. MAP12-44]